MDEPDQFPVWWVIGEWLFWAIVVTWICGSCARPRRRR